MIWLSVPLEKAQLGPLTADWLVQCLRVLVVREGSLSRESNSVRHYTYLRFRAAVEKVKSAQLLLILKPLVSFHFLMCAAEDVF